MIVKIVFLCDVSIRSDLFLKLQKGDKGEGIHQKNICVSPLHNYLRRIQTSLRKTVFTITT